MMTVIKSILFVPFVLIVLGIIGTTLNKAYWDEQVRLLCEKDGGVTVYESVNISKEQYLKNDGYKGMITVAPESTSKPYHEFYKKQSVTTLNKSNPIVSKSEFITYRKSDDKKLGKWVTYSRGGGDFPTGLHHSHFGCVDIIGFKTSSAKEIFSIDME